MGGNVGSAKYAFMTIHRGSACQIQYLPAAVKIMYDEQADDEVVDIVGASASVTTLEPDDNAASEALEQARKEPITRPERAFDLD